MSEFPHPTGRRGCRGGGVAALRLTCPPVGSAPTARALTGRGHGGDGGDGSARRRHAGREQAADARRSGDGQALLAHGANPALGDGVSVRGLDRCQDDLGTHRTPDVVEGPGELAVTVADQESDGSGLLIEHGHEVAGLLGDPGACGVGGDAGEVDAPVVQLDKNSTYSRCRNTVSTVRRSQATMPAACPRRNDRHVVEAGRGAGWRPLARATLAMELPETRRPSAAAPRGCAGSPRRVLGGQP
jgi:hypothetical protein